ncbi:MAG: hypothetical protein UY62_C0055G0008 [Parcubacteria group bacterium GW2011_GWF2_50_9]|nr:MAG: hypothetical protein UY62_C0055G0008 [Parcubacteria group bacterium GW2011_GWF2_50_9]
MNGKKTGIIDPILLQSVSVVLTAFLGNWKRLGNDFNLIESAPP